MVCGRSPCEAVATASGVCRYVGEGARAPMEPRAIAKAPEGEGCPRCGGFVYAAEQMLARGRVSTQALEYRVFAVTTLKIKKNKKKMVECEMRGVRHFQKLCIVIIIKNDYIRLYMMILNYLL